MNRTFKREFLWLHYSDSNIVLKLDRAYQLVRNDKLRMQMLWQVFHCLVYAERLSQCSRLDCRLSLYCLTSTLCQGNWK